MTEEEKKGKKIITDEDWKQQAQKEKETLAAKEKMENEQAKAKGRSGPLPKGDFTALISVLATQAFYALGLLDVGEEEKAREPDLNLAKYNIDMLETLEEKTKGNLTAEEEKTLQNLLNQLRMAYVKMAG